MPDPSKYIKNLPREVNNLLSTALAKNPGDRFADMNEFVEELSVISGTFFTTTSAKTAQTRPSEKRYRIETKACWEKQIGLY